MTEHCFLEWVGEQSLGTQTLMQDVSFTFLLHGTKPSSLYWFQLYSGVLFETLMLLLAQVSEEQGEKDNIYSGEGTVAKTFPGHFLAP